MRLASGLVLLGLVAGAFLDCPQPGPALAADAPSKVVPSGSAARLAAVGAACELIYAAILPTPGTIIEKFAGTIGDQTIPASAAGCMIIISGSWEELGDASSPEGVIFDLLTAKDWSQDLELSADGPDGTVFAFVKDGVRCVVRGRWDGGDDADSTYVPSDVYQVMVWCVPSE